MANEIKTNKLWYIPVILAAWLPFLIAAWDNTLPSDSTTWNVAAGNIRDNWDVLETQFGVDITATLETATVDLTNTEIKDLADTPVELVAAQGANTVIEFVSAIFILDYGSNVLVESDDNLVIEYDGGDAAAVSQAIEMTGFIDQSADTITCAVSKVDPIDASADIVNKNLALFNSGGNFTGNVTADTVIRVITSYRVHTSLGL